MTHAQLDVLIAGARAGTLVQDSTGTLSFSYLRSYRGVPLSSAMPLSTRTYRHSVVAPYLWGLLPEDPAARRSAAVEAGASPNNPFALLGVIGLDCPGAVQFCQPGADALREERLVPASDAQIARRLSEGRSGGHSWRTENERWSLGGQQSKFALRFEDGRWFSCEGAAATTHIFKSGVAGLGHQALNEYICMRLAASLGIPAAGVEYREFEGEPAVIVERYDRRREGGVVRRLHQEDLCQALGCLPANKYASDGGPCCADALGLLASSGATAQANAAGFLQMLFFNYLVGATDAHAKNYSILLDEGGAHRLAPMYDVASIAPYVEPSRWKARPPKLAMSVGGENRVGCVSMGDLRKMADQCALGELGITAEGCASLLPAYAEAIPAKLAELFDGLELTASAAAAKELRAHMEEPIVQLCERAVVRLGG